MRLLLASSLVLIGTGCASQIRTEMVGTGNGVVTTRTAAPAPVPPAAGIPLPRGTYNFDLRIGVPRAQVVAWRVSCPGAEGGGEVGEAFDAYRERRLKVLEAERDQQRKAYEAAIAEPPPEPTTTTTTTTVAPPPTVTSARVVTPVGRVIVRGTVQPPPVTVTRTETTIPVRTLPPPPPDGPVELAPGDDGRGIFPASIDLTTTADGVCTISAIADDPNVSAFFSITRVRDLRVEAAERKQALYVGAANVRTRLTAQLVGFGADETARQRRIETEARLRAEAERRRGEELARRRAIELRVAADEAERHRQLQIKLEFEARVRADNEARLRWEAGAGERARLALLVQIQDRALSYRQTYITWLIGQCHADPGRRDRLRIERERLVEARRAEQLRIKLERDRQLELRLRIERERIAAETARLAELERQRLDAALRIRMTLQGNLVAFGARLRPPRPAPLPENPGSMPFDGATWTAGRWTWVSLRGEWVWTAGGWSDPGRFGDSGGEVAVRPPPPPPDVVVTPPPPTTTTVIVAEPPPAVVVTPAVTVEVGGGYRPPTIVRDRRPPVRERAPDPRTPPRPVVRDRRDPPPVVRDHRGDKDARDDKKKRR